MISVQDWAEIRRLRAAEELSISEISRQVGVTRITVRKALASASPPRYERASTGSAADAFEDAIKEQLAKSPRMRATVIAQRVGWTRGMTVFKVKVAALRPAFLPPDPASRTTYLPGEIAQFDFWFPPISLDVGHGQVRTAKRLPVLTMACGYSRWRGALLVPSRSEQDLYAGWWALLEQLGAVPKVLVWDGESAVGRWRPKEPELTAACHAFRGVLGAKVLICRPGDPEAKGLLERCHDHYEKSFLPGREFTGPGDFNTQLGQFVTDSNSRWMRVLGARPADRIATDTAAMMALPPVPPVTGWSLSLVLPRDHYVRLDSNDYSIHPSVIGRRVQVRADLDRVWAICEGRVVADHPRSWARHQSFTDPAHAAAAHALRRSRFGLPRPDQELAGQVVQVRELSTYDTAFGIDTGQEAIS
ncbi:IS21 family transposase [Ornithinimicrobium sp. Y1847]|uniref:IS21 family transposase n=1 Tax=Ornithinimicrobium sp. Y1847 TaxID=3405419 RepID=UPI003B67552C